MRFRKVLRVAAIAAVLVSAIGSNTAWSANGDVQAQCGRVQSYTPPTNGTAGSIVLGSRTFQVQRSSNVTIGSSVCLVGPVLASYIFDGFTTSAISDQQCAMVNNVFKSTSVAPGSISVSRNPEFIFKLPIGSDLPANVEGTQQCVTIGLDTQGDAIVTAFTRPAAGPNTLPSTGTLAAPNSSDSSSSLLLLLGLGGLLAAGVALARVHRARH